MDYDKMRDRLDDETGSQFIVQAVLAEGGEASYDEITEYVDAIVPEGYMPEEEFYSRIHTLQALGMLETDTTPVLGEETDEDLYSLTETGEEFLEEDSGEDIEQYQKTLEAIWDLKKSED